MLRKIPLHVQILTGILLGLVWGVLAGAWGFTGFTVMWVKPFGTIFINLLKLIAMPLVVVTIIGGIASLSDLRKLASIGTRTLGWFTGLTVTSVLIGLLVCLALAPGHTISADQREQLKEQFAPEVSSKVSVAQEVSAGGPLRLLIDLMPENVVKATSDNRSMLQVICFSVLVGIALVTVPRARSAGFSSFIDGMNHVFLAMVRMIMQTAPVGVFALLAGLIAEMAGDNPANLMSLLGMLGKYALSFTIAIAVLMFVVYPVVVRRYMKTGYLDFLKKMVPVQLVAFSTSSSAASLPVNMDCVENRLGVRPEVAGFVLPLGVTINMNGTAVHQGLCAVFIAQVFGVELGIGQYLIILLTGTLAAMGAPGVPGSGLIMMLMVFSAIGVPEVGLALIIAIDRPLDMLRTIPNVLGDAIVAGVVHRQEPGIKPG
jgi:Na+/H+-dicarboxylate symporter